MDSGAEGEERRPSVSSAALHTQLGTTVTLPRSTVSKGRGSVSVLRPDDWADLRHEWVRGGTRRPQRSGGVSHGSSHTRVGGRVTWEEAPRKEQTVLQGLGRGQGRRRSEGTDRRHQSEIPRRVVKDHHVGPPEGPSPQTVRVRTTHGPDVFTCHPYVNNLPTL